MRKSVLFNGYIYLALTLLLTVLLSACGSDRSGLEGGGTGDVGTGNGGTGDEDTVLINSLALTVGSATSTINSTESIAVRASAVGTNNQPLSDVTISFSASLGDFNSVTAKTNELGIAEVLWKPGAEMGTSSLRAYANGIYSPVVAISIAPGTPDSIKVTSQTTNLAPRGSTAINILVTDSEGNPISGEVVNLSIPGTSSGSISSSSATTNNNGQADINYTAGTTAGTDIITARLNSNSSITNSLEITVTAINQSGYPQTLTLTPLGGTAIVANGSSTTLLRVFLSATDGNPIENATVALTTNYGSLDDQLGTSGQNIQVNTNNNGTADVLLRSSAQITSSVVSASYGGLNDVVVIDLVAGPADDAQSSIGASPQSLPADGASISEIIVSLRDASGNVVPDGTVVTLNSTAGTIYDFYEEGFVPSLGNSNPTTSGRAIFWLRAPTSQQTATLTVAGIPSLQGSVAFGTKPSGVPANIQLSVSSPEISVKGVGKDEFSNLTISVTDSSGNAIADPVKKSDGGEDETYNNLRISFVASPNGGEYIAGFNNANGYVTSITDGKILASTESGNKVVTVASGTLPGVLEIKVELLDADGSVLLTAISPQLAIASGPPHAIAIVRPSTQAGFPTIVTTAISGLIRTGHRVMVADRYGNPVPDGTIVGVSLMDTEIHTGNTTSTIESELVDNSVADFATIFVNIDGSERRIEGNDWVLIKAAPAADRVRNVADIHATAIDVSRNYNTNNVNAVYQVGAALTGAFVSGITETPEQIETMGTVQINKGLGIMILSIPEDRALETPFREIWIIARASDDTATLIEDSNFTVHLPVRLEASPLNLSATGNVTITAKDNLGNNLQNLPILSSVNYNTTNTGELLVDAKTGTTGENGQFTSVVTVTGGVSGDTATITYSALNSTVEVTVEIVETP